MKTKKISIILLILAGALLLVQCRAVADEAPAPVVEGGATPQADPADATESVRSPDGRIEVIFGLDQGAPYYQVSRDGQAVIARSRLGVTIKDDEPLNRNFVIGSTEPSTFDETWTQPWGEVKEIRNHYNELRLELVETSARSRRMVLVFRAYDDGLGFRYEWPEQEHLGDFEIMNEQTEFVLTGDPRAWWIPAFWPNRYEYLYEEARLSEIAKNLDGGTVHTPLTLETEQGLYLSIHEAALVDYASMALAAGRAPALEAELVPWSDGVKVRVSTPQVSPWRTIQIAENPGDLITSYLILNLNEPNKLGDVAWVEPGKYVGIWWGMHIGKYTWEVGPQHGATTENANAYIDFAAEHGFDGVLVEGWNLGWDGDWTANGDQISFTQSYPDFDLEAVTSYAAAKGVRLIGHNETAAAIGNYEAQVEEAFALYHSLGMNTVKTGYVGWGKGIKRYDEDGFFQGLEWHHGQYMVEHHQRITEIAAQHQIMLDVHEPIKDTGLRRTYPNLMTREGARGQEYNAWSEDGGNPPDHTTILPFTRLLAGPMDFTPGIFDLFFDAYKPDNRVNTTLAKQLALYVVIYSPLQMAADLPENYMGQPAFQFIEDVPVDWDDTRVLHAQIGDFVTIVRKDRDSDDWYLGSTTDEEPRTLEAQLAFLAPGQPYVAEIYADGAQAHWEDNPLSIEITQFLVDSEIVMTIRLAPGGGAAIRFRPASAEEADTIPRHP